MKEYGSSTEELSPLVIIVIDDLMKRIKEKFDTSIMFIDSSAAMERFNLPVFILSIWTPYGGLPIAVLILSDETKETLNFAFQKLKDFGIEINNVFTDDCSSLRNSLKNVWDQCITLLCTWHFTQAWWTWLLDSKHLVEAKNRQEIMRKIQFCVFEKDETKVRNMVNEIKTISNSVLQKKFDKDINRIEEWAHYSRKSILKISYWSKLL